MSFQLALAMIVHNVSYLQAALVAGENGEKVQCGSYGAQLGRPSGSEPHFLVRSRCHRSANTLLLPPQLHGQPTISTAKPSRGYRHRRQSTAESKVLCDLASWKTSHPSRCNDVHCVAPNCNAFLAQPLIPGSLCSRLMASSASAIDPQLCLKGYSVHIHFPGHLVVKNGNRVEAVADMKATEENISVLRRVCATAWNTYEGILSTKTMSVNRKVVHSLTQSMFWSHGSH
ncbi:uncharacterized protein LOC109511885 [Hippocampus comes]|uniref:uncharacterized protein LOC109511885 n=1 Tax=Hippocampus comes TaxID=109280 RepID=UPI00094EDCE4|nr:PREDICTED: uncharacterized protein LOC109511885 [Hippocampus comes]